MCFHLAQTAMTHGCERPRSSGGTNLLPAPAPALPQPSDPADRSALACARLSSAPGPGPGPCSTHRGPGAVPGCPPCPTDSRTSQHPIPSCPSLALLSESWQDPASGCWTPGAGRLPGHTAQTGPGCRVPAPPAPQSSQSQALLPQPLRGRALEPRRQLSSHHASSRSTIHLLQVPRWLQQGSDQVWLPSFPLILLILQHQRLRHLLQPRAAAVAQLCSERLPRERAVWPQCRPSRVSAVPGLATRGSARPCPGQSWALQDGHGEAGSAPGPPAARAGMSWGCFGDVLQAGGLWAMGKGLEGCGHLGAVWDPW